MPRPTAFRSRWPGVINPLLEHPTLAARRMTAFTDPLWNPRIYEAAMTGLGMSETGSNHTGFYLEERALPQARGTVGRAIPFVEHRIADEETGEALGPGETGNSQVRGYSVMAAGDIPFLYNGKLDFRALVSKIADSPER